MTLQRSIRTVALILATAVCFVQKPSPAAAPAGPPPTPGRQSAQGSLDNLTARDHDALKALIDSTTDPEAKARLNARLQQIEDRMAYDPPPLTFQLNDATLPDVVAALNKATGERFSIGNLRSSAKTKFTLYATEMPFWEIIRKLNDQHRLEFTEIRGSGIAIVTPGAGISPHSIVGGVAFFANLHQAVGRGAPVVPSDSRVAELRVSARVDPRIKIIRSLPLRILAVRDDAGTDLIVPSRFVQSARWSKTDIRSLMGGGVQIHAAPANPRKKTALVQGELTIAVDLASESLDVADARKNINKPLVIAGNTIVISQFDYNDTGLTIRMSREIDPKNPDPLDPVFFSITNGEGHVFFVGSIDKTFTRQERGKDAVPGPWKIQFGAVTKVREVTIPFELKDLPLP